MFLFAPQRTCPPGCLLPSDKWLKVVRCRDDTREDRAVLPADTFAFILVQKGRRRLKLTGAELVSHLACPAIGSCCPLTALWQTRNIP